MNENFYSDRVKSLYPSASVSIADKIRKMSRNGINVIQLQTGEPDFDTPAHIKKSAIDALKNGFTHYSSSQGLIELREAVSKKLEKENKIIADPETEIIITCGAIHGFFLAINATINAGDEVIILEPSWIPYTAIVKLVGGIPIQVPLNLKNNFTLDIDAIKKRISSKTKMIILNYPSNPTGTTYSNKDLEKIAVIAEKNNLIVISDEIYEKIIYDGISHYSFSSLKGMKDRTITLNGFSKTYAMTGWRLGYVNATKDIIAQMLKIQQYTITNPCTFAQKGAIAALKGPQYEIKNMINEYAIRREIIVEGLNNIEGILCEKPMGTFYIFLNISKFSISSEALANFLLEKAKVGVVPGTAYGKSGEGYIRLSFANSQEKIRNALIRIEGALLQLKKEW